MENPVRVRPKVVVGSDAVKRRSARINTRKTMMLVNAGDNVWPVRRGEVKSGERKVSSPSDRFMKLEGLLIPGLPNDITLGKISTKPSSYTLRTLSMVSRTWRQALKGRLVYGARVRAGTRDSCLIINDTQSLYVSAGAEYPPRAPAIFLYLLRDSTLCKLPPIRGLVNGFPYDCECIALNGRVYVLGGSKRASHGTQRPSTRNVYVLDLAGEAQWKRCAPMKAARATFTCAVRESKIYVFGGICGKGSWARGSEVYDPSLDSWFKITPMPGPGWFWAASGRVRGWDIQRYRDFLLHDTVGSHGEEVVVSAGGGHLLRYYPVTDKWRLSHTVMNGFDGGDSAAVIVNEGKLYSITMSTITVCDLEQKTVKENDACFYEGFLNRTNLLWPITAIVVENEVFVIMERRSGLDRCILQSKGFGTDMPLEWEKLPMVLPTALDEKPLMCYLQL